MLGQTGRPEILAWDQEEGDGTVKTYVWLHEQDFIIIMKKYPDNTRRLITSFWVEYEHTRRKFRKKYNHRL
jgi:transcription initiation factor IIE alpha subunit